MNSIAGSKAIIIDVSESGGGYPDMVQYLSSYFFLQNPYILTPSIVTLKIQKKSSGA